MKVKKSDWHYKVYSWITPKDEYRQDLPSVCEYWASIFIKGPLMVVLFCILAPFIPMIWVILKIGDKLEKRVICPLGKIEIES